MFSENAAEDPHEYVACHCVHSNSLLYIVLMMPYMCVCRGGMIDAVISLPTGESKTAFSKTPVSWKGTCSYYYGTEPSSLVCLLLLPQTAGRKRRRSSKQQPKGKKKYEEDSEWDGEDF